MKLTKGFIEDIKYIPENRNSKPYNEKFDSAKVLVSVTLEKGCNLSCNIYPDIKAVTTAEITEDFVSKLKTKLIGRQVICSNFTITAIREILIAIL